MPLSSKLTPGSDVATRPAEPDAECQANNGATSLGSWRLGAAVVLVVLIVNVLVAVVLLPALRRSGVPGLADADSYLDLARNLAAGHGYVLEPGPHLTLRRMPAYPFFLAALLHLTGGNEDLAALLQVSLSAGSAALCFATLRSLGRLAATTSALAVGLHPVSVVYASRFHSENLSIFLSSLALFFLARWLSRETWRAHLGFCLSLAGALLTRTTILIWAVPSLLVIASQPASRRRFSRWMAGPLVAMIVVVPWIARNWIVTGELVVGSSWNSRSALHGLRNAVQPEFGSHPRDVDDATIAETDAAMARILGPIDSARKEMAEDRLASRRVIEELLRNPLARTRAFALGLVRAFYLTTSRPMRTLVGLANACLLLLAGVGWWLRRNPRPLDFYLWLLVGTFWLFHALVFPMVRYQAPALPALALLAGIGLDRACARRAAAGSHKGRPMPVSGG